MRWLPWDVIVAVNGRPKGGRRLYLGVEELGDTTTTVIFFENTGGSWAL
jgi:hypothetical protein